MSPYVKQQYIWGVWVGRVCVFFSVVYTHFLIKKQTAVMLLVDFATV